jgi:hypothetical protein
MPNAHNIIDEIDTFLSKSMLKTSKLTKEEFINFIEQKWNEADDAKYNIHQAYIISSRMVNEYIWAKDFDNMMRWLIEMNNHLRSKEHPVYVNNYYNGQCCLECGNEEKALEYFNLCYQENKDYIYSRAPFCYEFFNKYLENPRELPNEENTDNDGIDKSINLKYWQEFFDEEEEEFSYEILKNDFEYAKKLNSKHKKGLEFLKNNQELILKNILTELLKKYPELQEKFDYSDEDKPEFMPDINDIGGFADLLSPTRFYVVSVYKDDYPFIGFSFSCSWDSEHALGVMTHKDRIIDIEDAEMAFAIWRAKEDLKKTKN